LISVFAAWAAGHETGWALGRCPAAAKALRSLRLPFLRAESGQPGSGYGAA